MNYIISPTPTWPPTQHREGNKKDENNIKSVHTDNCSYVKAEFVSSALQCSSDGFGDHSMKRCDEQDCWLCSLYFTYFQLLILVSWQTANFFNWKIFFKMTIIRVIHSIQIRSKSWVEVSWGKPEGLTSVLYRAKKRTCCWVIHWFTPCLCVSVLAAGGSVHFPGLCDGRLPDQLHGKSTTINTFWLIYFQPPLCMPPTYQS